MLQAAIIEGRPSSRHHLKGIEGSGLFEVAVEAEDAAQGIQAVCWRSGTLDLVLLDGDLPSPDGVAILPVLRAVAPDVPVVVLVDRPTEAARSAALRSGAAGFLAKGMPGDSLAWMLAEILHPLRERPVRPEVCA